MPTENRSSNTEMVSVKRELVEQAMQACFEAGFGIPHDALRDVLAKPAQQHQCEPVALPARKAHKKGNSPMQNAKNSAWNACLDEIAKLGPLYTHADPAEVERLRAENKRLWTAYSDQQDKRITAQGERDTLRTQLAERDVLLADISKRHWSGVDFDLPADLVDRIKALSASAEPEVKS